MKFSEEEREKEGENAPWISDPRGSAHAGEEATETEKRATTKVGNSTFSSQVWGWFIFPAVCGTTAVQVGHHMGEGYRLFWSLLERMKLFLEQSPQLKECVHMCAYV